jgi:hypothetical protein
MKGYVGNAEKACGFSLSFCVSLSLFLCMRLFVRGLPFYTDFSHGDEKGKVTDDIIDTQLSSLPRLTDASCAYADPVPDGDESAIPHPFINSSRDE